jgi:hypothetical protein
MCWLAPIPYQLLYSFGKKNELKKQVPSDIGASEEEEKKACLGKKTYRLSL